MNLDPEKLRARFHELTRKANDQRAKSEPIRAERDKVAVRHAKEIEKHNAKVRAAEKGLYEIDQERALIARALGGRVGEPE
jgi:hypothetical protein